ncbi:MAG: hypothetical protein ACRDO7_12475, partial [Nocardioidaceae bacterium]
MSSPASADSPDSASDTSRQIVADKNDKDKGPTSTISGVLLNAEEGNAPVEGVTVVITTSEGDEVEAVSDAAGKFEVEVPATGETTIELDTSTLPEGVELRSGTQNPLTVTLDSGRPEFSTVFPIGADTRDVETWYDRIPQIIWDGAYFGVVLALGSLGLSMIGSTTGLANFAHGELVTFGALMA